MIRNIIFDWSGTLVDDLPAVWKATNFIFEQAQREPLTLEQFRAEFCLPFRSFYERYVPHIAEEQLEVWFHGSFRQSQDSVVPLPHAREFLEFCREKKIKTFLLTAVQPEHFKVQAESSGFGPFLDKTYLGVMDKRHVIHTILEENRLEASETIFIGDMQHDIDTAKHGGVGSCAVLTGYNNLNQLRASHPDLIVEHLGELKTILQQNGMNLQPTANHAEPMPVVTVGALIFNDADKVLMVCTHKWSNLWGIPGGKTKWGEDSVSALRREIKEETDLEIHNIQFELVQDCIHSKEFYRDAHFVLLNYTAHVSGKAEVKLNEEARDFVWATIAEALAMPINQPTRVLLESVQARGLRN